MYYIEDYKEVIKIYTDMLYDGGTLLVLLDSYNKCFFEKAMLSFLKQLFYHLVLEYIYIDGTNLLNLILFLATIAAVCTNKIK